VERPGAARSTWGNALSVRDILVDTSGPDDILVVATDDGLYRSIDSGGRTRRSRAARGTVPGPGDLEPGAYQRRSPRRGAALLLHSADFLPDRRRPLRLGRSGGDLDADPEWRRCLFRRRPRDAWRRRSGDAIVYAFAEVTAANDQRDLYRSTDGGLNWAALGINAKIPSNPNTDNPNMDLMRAQSWYNQTILVDPRDPSRNTVYLGGQLASARQPTAAAPGRSCPTGCRSTVSRFPTCTPISTPRP